MERRKFFVELTAASVFALLFGSRAFSCLLTDEMNPEKLYFKDDGTIPNSKYPLLWYRAAFSQRGDQGADWIEQHFAKNRWTNSWRYGVYPFHHYHSTSHEVLGCFSGNALLHLGGEKGEKVRVEAGDVVVIPAGVGHKCIEHSNDFTVVGAYPNGMDWDLLKGEPGDRPKADRNIARVPFPDTDPYLGSKGGLVVLWEKSEGLQFR